jgi:hypothetical protein
MSKRNKHWLREKEFIRLNKQLQKNREAQRNLGYVELDEPIFIGWNATLIPREDIQNRKDSWVFWSIAENLSSTTFAKKISDFDWNRKVRPWENNYPMPRIYSISESTYNTIYPEIRRWFTNEVQLCSNVETQQHPYYGNRWFRYGKSYYCKIPDFYWTIKYEKVYKTKSKIFDCILQQEEAEILHILKTKFYHQNRRYSNAPKDFRKSLNRSQRAKSKQTLYNIVYKNMDCEFEDNYRSANWLYW